MELLPRRKFAEIRVRREIRRLQSLAGGIENQNGIS